MSHKTEDTFLLSIQRKGTVEQFKIKLCTNTEISLIKTLTMRGQENKIQDTCNPVSILFLNKVNLN